MICSKCGKRILTNAKYCTNCGTKLEYPESKQTVYGVPKRNADRPAWGNYAAAGGNINRRKREFRMRWQAVDRGWPRWYHESAFTHVQDRATLESDLSGI